MSDISQLPPNVQERVARLQQLQNTMQQLLAQRQRLEAEMSESERALKTLEETPAEAKTYRSVGAILVERDRETLRKELGERIDFLGMRKKVLEKQEEKAKERLQELQQTLQKELGVTQ
jgi:prefoldin beta subunit